MVLTDSWTMKHTVYDQYYTGQITFFKQELLNVLEYTNIPEATNLCKIKIFDCHMYETRAKAML